MSTKVKGAGLLLYFSEESNRAVLLHRLEAVDIKGAWDLFPIWPQQVEKQCRNTNEIVAFDQLHI